MKYIYLLILLAFIGCGNKKAEIVEQIKLYKDSLIIAQMNDKGFAAAADHILVYKKLTDYDKKFLKAQNFSLMNHKSLDSMQIMWWLKSSKAKSIIDSLELELKKY